MGYFRSFVGCSILLMSSASFSAEYTVLQQQTGGVKQFDKKEMTIKVGDIVHFQNQDAFFHNVMSLSDVKTFDLGSYPKGESRAVTFDKPGTVEVECAIHPEMHMTIKVTP